MRLDVIISTSVAKGVNKARYTGKFSLLAVAKLDMLKYYSEYAKTDTKTFIELQDRINKMLNNNRLELCNIREASCVDGVYVSDATVVNPYNPQGPAAPVEPEPEPQNLPASIDDYSITVEKNTTTVLTIAMFTSVYSDPENDALDAIRIDKIHSTNNGIFYLNGVAIYEGLVISRAEIEAERLTHVSADAADIQTDSFDFSARDSVNGTWVN